MVYGSEEDYVDVLTYYYSTTTLPCCSCGSEHFKSSPPAVATLGYNKDSQVLPTACWLVAGAAS